MFTRGQRVLPALLGALLLAAAPALRAARAAVEAPHGGVASAHELASRAGVEILKKGGNAVDAAVATGLALEVVYPFAGNLGGGGFMLIHLADGRDLAVDYRETAPAAAAHDMYLGPDGSVRDGPGSSTLGWRASGVPGSVAGFALALEKYGSGRITWAEAVEPARRLAADGHLVSETIAAGLRHNAGLLGAFADSKEIYLNGGAFWKAGDLWRQPDLAATLARLQQSGPREFYEGETARKIADAMGRNGGTIALADLKNYRAVVRAPLRGAYRGYEIVTMPPPSSGGIALLQMLGMLEPFDVRAMGPDTAVKFHLFHEVLRRAFRDRAEYLGDPDFVDVPAAGLLDRGYLARLMKNFDPHHATASAGLAPGRPEGFTGGASGGSAPRERRETTHFSVVDGAGNAVANTYTLNGGFGSGVTIPGTGILMNNEMDDFTAKSGVPNMFGLIQGEANAIVAGKRPLSSMTPTFVLRDGKLLLVTGSPGGPTIISTVLEIITNLVDHEMPVMPAVEAPRFHHQWMPDTFSYERGALTLDTFNALTAMGHNLARPENSPGFGQGDAETIAIDPKTNLRLGVADPRNPSAAAVGY